MNGDNKELYIVLRHHEQAAPAWSKRFSNVDEATNWARGRCTRTRGDYVIAKAVFRVSPAVVPVAHAL